MDTQLQRYYRKHRQHQRDVYPSMVTIYPSGRTELTAASAPYGEHALSAYRSAKQQIHFMENINKKTR